MLTDQVQTTDAKAPLEKLLVTINARNAMLWPHLHEGQVVEWNVLNDCWTGARSHAKTLAERVIASGEADQLVAMGAEALALVESIRPQAEAIHQLWQRILAERERLVGEYRHPIVADEMLGYLCAAFQEFTAAAGDVSVLIDNEGSPS